MSENQGPKSGWPAMNVVPNNKNGTCSLLRGMGNPCVGMILLSLRDLEPNSEGSPWYVLKWHGRGIVGRRTPLKDTDGQSYF